MAFEKNNAYTLQYGNFEKNKKKKKKKQRGCVSYFVKIFYFEEILCVDEWSLDSS